MVPCMFIPQANAMSTFGSAPSLLVPDSTRLGAVAGSVAAGPEAKALTLGPHEEAALSHHDVARLNA